MISLCSASIQIRKSSTAYTGSDSFLESHTDNFTRRQPSLLDSILFGYILKQKSQGMIVLNEFKNSMRRINYKLYWALLILGLCPTIYSTVRVFFLGQLPNEWSYSIAGQLSWVNLLYEIINEAILLPLFFFIGRVVQDRKDFSNRIRSGLLVTLSIYSFMALCILCFARPMLGWMAANGDIIDASATYIRIESVANIFGMLCSFTLVALVTLNREKYLYILTAARLVLCLVFDTALVSSLPFSLQLGVNGIGYSNILVNGLLFAVSVYLLQKEGICIMENEKLSFSWMKDFVKIGGLSGLESFVRNIAYMLMIVRMVNVVNEQGVYWVANGFIWGWLLLPVNQLAELIKQEISTSPECLVKNSKGYFGVTGIICGVWVLSIPLWKPFMQYVLGYSDVDKLFRLVLILLGFYALYALQNVCDATFYALGKTSYMLFESVVTNTVYYGTPLFFTAWVFGRPLLPELPYCLALEWLLTALYPLVCIAG